MSQVLLDRLSGLNREITEIQERSKMIALHLLPMQGVQQRQHLPEDQWSQLLTISQGFNQLAQLIARIKTQLSGLQIKLQQDHSHQVPL